MYTTHFVENGEIQTAYHDLGSGAPLLFVHGFTGSKLDFANQLAWFVETHRTLAYDHRGHGESSNLGPYDLQTLVDDLIRLLDALEIPTCHVLGHSLGGMVVMRAVLARPERFRSVILMDTAPYALNLFDEGVRRNLNRMVTDAGCAALLDGMQNQPQRAVVQRGIDFLGEQEHWRRIRVKLEQMDPQAFVGLGRELSANASVLQDLERIGVPTTIIVGAEDEPFLKPAQDMQKHIPDSTLAIIRNAAHSPQYENADVWRDQVLAHLTRAD